MSRRKRSELPLVYSCSGCSSAAQLANAIALRLDHEGEAEMSCIAGVGGGVPKLVRTAASGRPVLALDGCHLACVSACLAGQELQADSHHVLTDMGAKKRYHEDYDPDQADILYPSIRSHTRRLRRSSSDS